MATVGRSATRFLADGVRHGAFRHVRLLHGKSFHSMLPRGFINQINDLYSIMCIMRTGVPLAIWWSERLHNLTKRWQGFAGGRVFRQCRIACGAVEMRMRFAGKTEHAGDRDVGMADALTEEIRRFHVRALPLQHLEAACDLGFASLDP